MKVSVITAVLNSDDTIEDCIKSVAAQTYAVKEHIIIDGGSTDGTLQVIKKYEGGLSQWISAQDKGIYEALNKGLRLAKGDIVGILHADDLYAHDRVLERVVSDFKRHGADCCYGDLVYVKRNDAGKVVRYWRSRAYSKGLFERGWMPPHPTFFARREIYEKYGYFNTGLMISADYELMLRFMDGREASSHYIPEVLVRMRTGGVSNKGLKNLIIKTSEDYKAWSINRLRRRFYTIPFKILSKVPQFFMRGESSVAAHEA